MNLLSIQGHFAPAFRLNKADAAELKKQVEIISQEHVLVISSKFRTDLFYYDVDDHVEEIIRIWCDISGVTYNDSTKIKFFRSRNELLTLTHFFYRLQLLFRMPQWHKAYSEELLSMWIENPKEPVLGILMKVMILLNESCNEHTLKLNETEFKQVVGRFINLRNLTFLNNNTN